MSRQDSSILPTRFEEACSGRSECGVCRTNIIQGETRVGTQRFFFKRGIAVRWHHVACALEQKLVTEGDVKDQNIDLSKSHPYISLKTHSEKHTVRQRQMYIAAARAAIYEDIVTFRDKTFKASLSGIPVCPILKKALTRENCHVHHTGPKDFKAIIDEFGIRG